MTRSSHRWRSRPGSFDTLHGQTLFAADNSWGIPALSHAPVTTLPRWLVPYRQRIRSQRPLTDGAVHFFLDDYRCETVWQRPFKALSALRPYTTLLTPDFSLYRDWPQTLQLWNVYRSRWCGCFWAGHGFHVIPTVSWSTVESYAFCFLGLPPRSVVAVSAVGVNLDNPLEYRLFVDGFQEMVSRLAPTVVLAYGPLPEACSRLVETVSYPTRWTNIRVARQT